MNEIFKVLNDIKTADIPEKIGEKYNKVWLKAVVRVRRKNGKIGFCLAENKGTGKPQIVKDYNPCGIIDEVISIHPYEEIDPLKMRPKKKYTYNDESLYRLLVREGMTEEEAEKKMSFEGKNDEEILKSREEIDEWLQGREFLRQKMIVEEERRCREIVEKQEEKTTKKRGKNGKKKQG